MVALALALLIAVEGVCALRLVAAYRDAWRIHAGVLPPEPNSTERSHLRDEADIAALAAYLEDPKASPRFRRRVTSVLASTKPGGGQANAIFNRSTEPTVIPILAPLLEADPDPLVRRSAAFGLRSTDDQAACRALLHALSDSDRATRIHAIIGLGDLRSRSAVEPLARLLNDRSFRLQAAHALAIRDLETRVGLRRPD